MTDFKTNSFLYIYCQPNQSLASTPSAERAEEAPATNIHIHKFLLSFIKQKGEICTF